MVILLNSSKTMVAHPAAGLRSPALLAQARQLTDHLRKLSTKQLQAVMHISPDLAARTQQLIADWTAQAQQQTAALDCFQGDIYRGFQATEFNQADRQYADKVLLILSGLYGGLRALDGIYPYRLEMMYKLQPPEYKDLYQFWGKAVVGLVPDKGMIINLASVEYSRLVTPFVDADRLIAPQFLTAKQQHGKTTFVTVHAKAARGAFASWLIRERVTEPARFKEFTNYGYQLDVRQSTPRQPVFIRPDRPMVLANKEVS